jgi:ABC-type sugar transport system substrate-binding protein
MSRKTSSWLLVTLLAIALITVAMVAAACGTSSTTTSASQATTTSATTATSGTTASSMATTTSGGTGTTATQGKVSFGVVLPTKDEPRWIQDQTRFQDAFKAAGYDVQILFSQGDSAVERQNVESLINQGV